MEGATKKDIDRKATRDKKSSSYKRHHSSSSESDRRRSYSDQNSKRHEVNRRKGS
jgi:hypothetical protein